MASREDVLQAKQTLSSSLLRSGLRGGVVGMAAARRVDRAITQAGQNVHAVGVGRKEVNGVPTTDLCVRVYVVQKLAESLLPPVFRIPAAINGVPTDVIESPPAFIQARRATASRAAGGSPAAAAAAVPLCTSDRRFQQRPVVAGISAGHINITAGTIGYFCRSTRHGDDPGQVYVLSNNHVFADVNHGVPGDDLRQPSPADGGASADVFADLTRFVPLHLGGTVPNRVDAAIGRLRADVAHQAEVCSIGPVAGTAVATVGLEVRKHGRTTGFTLGKVTDDSYDPLVGMDHNDSSVVALFENQIRIDGVDPHPVFALGGDSGSLVIRKDDGVAVGLYFAGPESGTYGIANHIGAVLNELEIQLV